MRIHVLAKLYCRNSGQGNKLRAMGKKLDSGDIAGIDAQLFPLLNKIYSNPPKWKTSTYFRSSRCNEFKYSNKHELLTIHLSSDDDTIKAAVDTLKAIVKEIIELTGLTEFKGARIESSATWDEQTTFKGLDALPEVSITIGNIY